MMRAMMLAAITAVMTAAIPNAGGAATRVVPVRIAAPAPGFRTTPPAPVAVADSADTLYRDARQALNDGDYTRAAQLFSRITERFPRSSYAPDALYWQAFALYRAGGSDRLRDALRALDAQARRFPSAATHGDAAALATRIRGELAKRGDSQAAESVVADAHGAEQGCPSEDDDMRVAALNALMQMDAQQALPILRKVLQRRDACSVRLRKKAVFLVAQKDDAASADILLGVARNDPAPEVRRDAVFWLGQVHGDRAVPMLDSILRNSTDDELQQKALFALSQQDDPRASKLLRDLVQSPATSEDLKARAIFALGHFRGKSEDFAYLRELFPSLKSERLQEQVVQSIAQQGDAESRRWLLDVATDAKQGVEIRKKAIFWAGQEDGSAPALVSLYDRLPDQELKEQLIFALSQSDAPAATDKLIDIARHDTNRELRKKAIFWLGQRDDPRVRKLLEELIGNDSN
ncbi:MAG TPA: HEAT repeat domain-containing protein [Gemmatimonadaceae bacterium]|nr:HEAT repeat domain-containing protein [Gemmatimonadaceae bacterium]